MPLIISGLRSPVGVVFIITTALVSLSAFNWFVVAARRLKRPPKEVPDLFGWKRTPRWLPDIVYWLVTLALVIHTVMICSFVKFIA